jgi:competence protein ComEA
MKMRKVDRRISIVSWMAILGMMAMTAMVLTPPIAYGQAKAKALLNLNTASEKELEALKGVGPATAKKIIAGRPYNSVDELSKAGVPAKTIDAIKPFVTVAEGAPAPKPAASAEKAAMKVLPPAAAGAPEKAAAAVTEKSKGAVETTKATEEKAKSMAKLAPGQMVNINTASKAELDALPEIGPVKAQAIIDGRPYKKPEDIMKVKGIKEGTYNKIKDYITVK